MSEWGISQPSTFGNLGGCLVDIGCGPVLGGVIALVLCLGVFNNQSSDGDDSVSVPADTVKVINDFVSVPTDTVILDTATIERITKRTTAILNNDTAFLNHDSVYQERQRRLRKNTGLSSPHDHPWSAKEKSGYYKTKPQDPLIQRTYHIGR